MDIKQFVERNKFVVIVGIIILIALLGSQGHTPLYQWFPYTYRYNYVNVLDDKIDFSWKAGGWGYAINPKQNKVTIHTAVWPNNEKDHAVVDTANKKILGNYDFSKYYPCHFTGSIKIKCYVVDGIRKCPGWNYYSVSGDDCKVKVLPHSTYCVRGTNCEQRYWVFRGDAYIYIHPEDISGLNINSFDTSSDVLVESSYTLTWSVPKKISTVEFIVIISEMFTGKKLAGVTCNLDGYTATTNDNGEAKFIVSPGAYKVTCSVPDHENIDQEVEITSAGGWIDISTPKLTKTCEDYGYLTNPPYCQEGQIPEIVEIDDLTCYTGNCYSPPPTGDISTTHYLIGGIVAVLILILSVIYIRIK